MTESSFENITNALSFAAETINENGIAELNLWTVRPNGHYGDECYLGSSYCREFLRYLKDTNDTTILRSIVIDMVNRTSMTKGGNDGVGIGNNATGIEVAFFDNLSDILFTAMKAGLITIQDIY